MSRKLWGILFKTSNDPLQGIANLLLRTGVSLSMIYLHGWPKLLEYLNGGTDFSDPLGVGSELSLLLAIFAEVICSILLVLGAFSRLSVIPLIFTMLVVMFIVNAGQPPIYLEKASIFLMTYIFILLAGSGKYSVDAILQRSYHSHPNM